MLGSPRARTIRSLACLGTRKPLGSRAESVRRWPRALAGATAPSPQKSLEPGERQTVLCPRLRKLPSCHIRTSGQAQVPKKTGKKINRALLASGCEPSSPTLADGKEMPWELAALCPLRVFGREPGPELGDAWGRLGSLVEGGAGVPDSASRTGRGPQGPAARGWGTVCRHRE